MGFYEQISGARMHAAYFRPGGVAFDISDSTFREIFLFANQFSFRLLEIEELLTNNRIWRQRLVGVGVVSSEEAANRGLTGVILRSTGVNWDLRKVTPYEIYGQLQFSVPIGSNGDCFTRYAMRIEEMRQSTLLIQQCLSLLVAGPVRAAEYKMSSSIRETMKLSMESLIHHFEVYSNRALVCRGEAYAGIESPKGEFGVFLAVSGLNSPYRCKIRSPGFMHLQNLDYMVYNHFLADVTTVIGTQDIVFGEIDR